MIIAGNWKMNKTPAEAKSFALGLKKEISSKEEQKSFILLAPALHFGVLSEVFKGSAFGWGGQNCFIQNEGSFTGENSPKTMRDMGAGFCLAGHSERRALFQENCDLIQKKIRAVLNSRMTPVFCIGENLDQKEGGRRGQVLESQLKAIDEVREGEKILIAYEPVWAIGSGRAADKPSIKKAFQEIKSILGKKQFPLLYGGSVNSEQAQALAGIEGVSGFLIGKNSLNLFDFLSIYYEIKKRNSCQRQ